MSELDKKRKQLEKSFYLARRHYCRSRYLLEKTEELEGKAKFAVLINGGSEWEQLAVDRHKKGLSKLNKLASLTKKFEAKRKEALIRLHDHLRLTRKIVDISDLPRCNYFDSCKGQRGDADE